MGLEGGGQGWGQEDGDMEDILARLDQVLWTMGAKKIKPSLRTCERVAEAAVGWGCVWARG